MLTHTPDHVLSDVQPGESILILTPITADALNRMADQNPQVRIVLAVDSADDIPRAGKQVPSENVTYWVGKVGNHLDMLLGFRRILTRPSYDTLAFAAKALSDRGEIVVVADQERPAGIEEADIVAKDFCRCYGFSVFDKLTVGGGYNLFLHCFCRDQMAGE